jgi:tol-pal system protein YbgF
MKLRSVLDMGTRIFKGLLATGFAVVLVSGCASKPEEVEVVEEEPEVVSQPIETVAPVAPPKAAWMVRNGALYELGSDDEYVAVGTGKFYFDFDQAMVKRQGHADLNKHARYMAENSSARVRIEGHADERGTREYNLALGERRANAIRAYLTSQGASTGSSSTTSTSSGLLAHPETNTTAKPVANKPLNILVPMSKLDAIYELGPLANRLRAISLCCLLVHASHAYAAEPPQDTSPIAIESLSVTEKPFREPVIEDQPSAMEKVYQTQVLQQEVQELRGLVEELSHEIQQMKSRQADRYLELDRRFEDFRKQIGRRGSLGAQGPVVSSNMDPEQISGGDDGTVDPPELSSADEKSLYDSALELIRNRQYDMAIVQLDTVIDKYPEGQYAPNAYYWLGEVYAARPEPNYEMARQSLAQVISFFPEHRKVPDAAFKLGKVYHMMGDCVRAREILTQVVQQHQGTTVAKLSETYLRDKVSCD